MRLVTLIVLCFSFLNMAVAETKCEAALYYSPYCPYSQEVLAYLKKINKTIPLKNVKSSSEVKEELKQIGGVLEVPCLVIDGEAIYRSDAIIDWINAHRELLEDL